MKAGDEGRVTVPQSGFPDFTDKCSKPDGHIAAGQTSLFLSRVNVNCNKISHFRYPRRLVLSACPEHRSDTKSFACKGLLVPIACGLCGLSEANHAAFIDCFELRLSWLGAVSVAPWSGAEGRNLLRAAFLATHEHVRATSRASDSQSPRPLVHPCRPFFCERLSA
jgi:hypothetical protein